MSMTMTMSMTMPRSVTVSMSTVSLSFADRVTEPVILGVVGAVRTCVTAMGWIVSMEDVVIMCPLGRVVVLVGHWCWGWWWSSVDNGTGMRSTMLVVGAVSW